MAGQSAALRREPAPDPGEFWSSFWDEQGPGGGCLVTAPIAAALDRRWALVAASLTRSARVLDLGCGAATVGRALLRHRGDVHVTGVDRARVPAQSHPRLTVLASTRMESLPLADESFDAAVSQFGIEYGNAGAAAAELERVLRPGASFCFLVHHRDSAIVGDGAMRRRALRAATGAAVRSAFVGGDRAALDRQRWSLSKQFAGDATIAAIYAYLQRRIGCTRSERHVHWQSLIDMFSAELAMLAQLERSARSAPELGQWIGHFLSRMAEVGVSALRSECGQPIAWDVRGVR